MSGEAFERVATREGYDRWAEIYDGEDNPLVLIEEQYLYGLIDARPAAHVLDAGCGTGRHAFRLTALGARVTATDFSPGMLGKARSKPGAGAITFVEHDLTNPLPFADAEFDRVVCGLVLDHVPNLTTVFREFRRVCRPDGAVVISVMHPALMLLGVTARFTDPRTGRETRPDAVRHQISDYVTAAVSADLRIEHMSEHLIDESLAQQSPRSRKYLNWPMLLLLLLRLKR